MAFAALAAVLAAGGVSGTLPAALAETRILACEPEWAALAEEIGGDDVVVHSATHGGQDAHHIRARPSLIAQVRRADVLFCSGAELEIGWLPVLMQRGARRVVQPGQPGHIMAADHVALLERPEIIDRSLGDIHPSGNPHVHLDPRNIDTLAAELSERLALIEPANAEAYRRRLASFQSRWSEAADEWHERAARLHGMKVIVHHRAWAYLLHWAGLERVGSLELVSGVPPTASHLADLLERAKASDVKAILVAPYEPRDASEWLSERTGIPVLVLPFTVGGRPGVDDLFSLFDITLTLLEDVDDRP